MVDKVLSLDDFRQFSGYISQALEKTDLYT
jgi:hypothetical protein